MEGQPKAVAQAMECLGHGTPELPTPLAGERPEKSRSVLRFINFSL